jgi:hypothetical protein
MGTVQRLVGLVLGRPDEGVAPSSKPTSKKLSFSEKTFLIRKPSSITNTQDEPIMPLSPLRPLQKVELTHQMHLRKSKPFPFSS